MVKVKLKREIFLELNNNKSLEKKAFITTKKIFEKGSGLLNWEADIVNDWCFLSKYGLEPVVNSHIILFQIYKELISSEQVFNFSISKKRIKVLMVGSAISPYFVQCSDYLYHKNNEPVYEILAYDPLNYIVEKNIKEYEEEKHNRVKWEISQKKINDRYIWNGKTGQKLMLINDYFRGKDELNDKQNIIILPTCIYNKDEAEEFFLYIIKLLDCLIEKGVFIMQVDIIDKRSKELRYLCESLLKIGLREIICPIVLEGRKDSCFKREKVYFIATAIPADLDMGGNQVIFFWEKQDKLKYDNFEEALSLFVQFMRGYY